MGLLFELCPIQIKELEAAKKDVDNAWHALNDMLQRGTVNALTVDALTVDALTVELESALGRVGAIHGLFAEMVKAYQTAKEGYLKTALYPSHETQCGSVPMEIYQACAQSLANAYKTECQAQGAKQNKAPTCLPDEAGFLYDLIAEFDFDTFVKNVEKLPHRKIPQSQDAKVEKSQPFSGTYAELEYRARRVSDTALTGRFVPLRFRPHIASSPLYPPFKYFGPLSDDFGYISYGDGFSIVQNVGGN